jgi:hypothetical protein
MEMDFVRAISVAHQVVQAIQDLHRAAVDLPTARAIPAVAVAVAEETDFTFGQADCHISGRFE